MPGIINAQLRGRDPTSGMPPRPALPAKPPLGQPSQQAQPRVLTPEVHRIVIAAKKTLAQPAIAQQIVAMMKGGDPATAIAKATIFFLRQLLSQVKGQMPAAPMIISAAQEIIVDIARLGASAKLFPFSKELVGQAARLAIQIFQQQMQARGAQPPAVQPQPAAQPAQPAPAAQSPMPAPTAVPMGA